MMPEQWGPHLKRLQEALVSKDGDTVTINLDAWLQEVFATVIELVEQENQNAMAQAVEEFREKAAESKICVPNALSASQQELYRAGINQAKAAIRALPNPYQPKESAE